MPFVRAILSVQENKTRGLWHRISISHDQCRKSFCVIGLGRRTSSVRVQVQVPHLLASEFLAEETKRFVALACRCNNCTDWPSVFGPEERLKACVLTCII